MPLRAYALLFVSVATPAAAKGAAEELMSRVERRLKVVDALQRSNPHVCEGLVELSHGIPSSAVLSRLAFSRKTARWELTLSQGTREDAAAIVQLMVTKQWCSKPVSALEGTVASASCTVEDSRMEVALSVPTSRPVKPEVLQALRQKDEESQTVLPDVPALEAYAEVLEVAQKKGLVAGWSSKIGPAVPSPALDRFEVSASGSASFAGVAEVLCFFDEGVRRVSSVESFEIKQPRALNGEWVVDFSTTVATWRYRREDEQKEFFLEFREPQHPKYDPAAKQLGISQERSPFGPPAPLLAGSSRVLTGKECRKEGPPSGDGELEGRGLDEFSVAYVALKGPSPCAMLIDAQGKCHEIRRNAKLGPAAGKVTAIDAEAVTTAHFVSSSAADGRPIAVRLGLKVGGKATAPAWFCKQK